MKQLPNARLRKKYIFRCSVLLLSWQLTGCNDDTAADTTGPVITLNGNANIEVAFNAFFDDIGAQAVDDIDGEVPVTLEGTVDTSIPGTYELTYIAADSSGNTSELVRVVEVLSDPLLGAIVSMPAPPISFFFDGELIGADYWSQEPQILSAGVGFADILGVEFVEVTEGVAKEVGGARSSDISCGSGTGNYTTVATQDQLSMGYIQQVPYCDLKDGALGIDVLPIVFSWPVDTRTISLTDFQFTLNTGDIVRPLAASPIPNHEDNERNVVVVFGEFANRLPSDDANARYPIRLRIVQDNTPLLLVGPNNQLMSAVGMTWETSTSPYDENNGPRLVGAKLNRLEGPMRGESVSGIPNPSIRQLIVPANDASVLYGEGDFMLRMLTSGGFSPDGVSGVKPTDFERFFRIHVMGEEGNNVIIDKVNQDFNVKGGTLRVVGLSDLGQPEGGSVAFDECYREDRDNYIDIILVGDEDAARSITHLEIPSLDGGYSAFYNPGGPGRTPFEGVVYTSPGPADLEPVIIALDDPMRIDYTPTVSN